MRPSSLLPWVAALSCTAFLGSALYALLFDVLLTGSAMYPYGKNNILTEFRSTFPAALVISGLVGLPIAIAYMARRRTAWIAAAIAASLAVTLVVWAAIRLGDPIGLFLGLLFLVVLGFCLIVAGGVPIYLVLSLSGVLEVIRTRAAPLTFGPSDWRTWLLLVVALSPSATYGLHDTAHDYGCRYADLANHSALASKAGIAVDLDKAHWPRLKQVLERFAVTHGLYLEGSDPWRLARSRNPLDLHLCSPGKMVIAVNGWEDDGGRFRPSGDWSIDLRFHAPASDTEWRTTARALMSTLDAEWPGIRYLAFADLGPSFKRTGGTDCPVCQSKPLKANYRHCLGDRSDVRKEVMYFDADTVDWPRLQGVMRKFGASRGMGYTGAEISRHPNSVPVGTSLCSSAKLLVVVNPLSANDRRPGWHASLTFHVTRGNPDADETIKAFIAALDVEWPGAVGDEPKLKK